MWCMLNTTVFLISPLILTHYSLVLKSECSVLVTTTIFVCTCILKLSFQFSQTFNHHMQIFDFTTVSLSSIIVWLNVTLWLSKWINSNFELSNCTAFSFAHVNAIFVIFFSFFTFLSMLFPSMYSAMLSM